MLYLGIMEVMVSFWESGIGFGEARSAEKGWSVMEWGKLC